MCTVSWFFNENGYELFFNRDESRTRQIALPPTIHQAEGTHFIAPIDKDAGGTWIGVNQYGMSLCLLNYYQGSPLSNSNGKDYISRGQLVKSLLSCQSPLEVIQQTEMFNWQQFRPFILVIFAPDEAVNALTWNGESEHLQTTDVKPPLASSSFQPKTVINGRRQQFLTATPFDSAGIYRAFHASHNPERDAYSVCMHRPDAHTVSFSHIAVRENDVAFHYTPGSPCATSADPPVTLIRQCIGSLVDEQ